MLVPVILAGGKGTRLWPVSREARPKPFLEFGHRSLLQSALLHAANLSPHAVIISTSEDCFFQCDEELDAIRDELNGIDVRYLLEPESRDTAPSVRMAAQYAIEVFGKEAVLLVMPADQVVADIDRFRNAVVHAHAAAENQPVVMFHTRNAVENVAGLPARKEQLSGTHALPQLQAREDNSHSGNLVCLRAAEAGAVFSTCAPAIERAAASAWRDAQGNGNGVVRLRRDAFEPMPVLSLEDALAQHESGVAVLQEDFDCVEIRSWNELAELYTPDAHGNTVNGEAILLNARNTHVQSDGRLVAAVGVENLVIVDTPDALLVGSRDHAGRFGQVAERLCREGHEAGLLHRTVHRPWGTYCTLGEGENFKVKRLTVKPGAALSLQMHQHRSEHWVVVTGEARVVNGEREFMLQCEETTFIPAGNRHRLENVGAQELVVVETQTGSYLGEDDIVRFDDRYGRIDARPH